MRDGDGSPLLDLTLEEGDHAAIGAEDVAEPDGGEAGGVGVGGERAGADGGVGEALDHELAHALGGAHDVGRVDGLVGRHQDKPLDAVRGVRDGGLVGAEDVVLDGLLRVVLHQRHMLVGRRVEDDVGAVAREGARELVLVAHASDHDREVDRRILPGHLLAEGVRVVLVDVKHDQVLRGEPGDLAREFGPDAPRAARNQHRAARQVLLGGRGVQVHRVATQEVLGLDPRDAHRRLHREVNVDELDAQQVLRDHLEDLLAGREADPDDLLHRLVRGGRHGDEEPVDLQALHDLGDPVPVPFHARAVQAQVVLARVVVDQRHDAAAPLRALGHGVQQNGMASPSTLPIPDFASAVQAGFPPRIAHPSPLRAETPVSGGRTTFCFSLYRQGRFRPCLYLNCRQPAIVVPPCVPSPSPPPPNTPPPDQAS